MHTRHIYDVKKFWHYMLACHFYFYIEHQAKLYLVNKKQATRKISRWIVTLLEFNTKLQRE